MQRVAAVTGATGFVGGHVVRRFAQSGWRVRLLTRRLPVSPAFADVSVDAVIGDLDDAHALRLLTGSADAVVHIAGLIKAGSRAEFFAANEGGTRRLAEIVALGHEKPRFVLVSSIVAREPGLSDYAESKKAGETALIANAADMPWTILRPPAVYGPGDRETLNFFRFVQRGFAVLPSANGRVSLIHASDLAAAVVHAATSFDLASSVLELDDGRPDGYGWKDLVAIAAASLGARPRCVVAPGLLLRIAAGLGAAAALVTHEPPLLTIQKIRELRHPDWVCHDTRLIAASGWRSTIGIEEGFAKTVAWYRLQGWL